jgi:hypothetical protein
VPKRREYRELIRDLADCIDTILMYAGDPIRPSNIRTFAITPEVYEWIVNHSTRAKNLIHWYSGKIYQPMPVALPEGTTHENAPPVLVDRIDHSDDVP